MRNIVLCLAGASLLATAGVVAQETQDKGPVPRLPAVQFLAGMFQSADLKTGTLKVKTRQSETVLSLHAKDIPITGDISRKMTLKELEMGTQVLLKLSGQGDIVGVHCIGPQVRGKLLTIDASKRTVTVAGHGALPLAAVAQVAVGGRYPQLADVPTGGNAVLRLTVDRAQIVRLHVVSTANPTPLDPVDETRGTEGLLEDIDLANGTIRIRVAANYDREKTNLPVLAAVTSGLLGSSASARSLHAASALVAPRTESRTYPSHAWVRTSLVDGRGNGLADLMPGMHVKVWFAAAREEVIFVKAEPTLRGVLKSINSKKNTITLVAPSGQPEPLYQLETNALLSIHGWDSELQDFQPGWTVSLVLTKDNRVRALWTLVNLLDK